MSSSEPVVVPSLDLIQEYVEAFASGDLPRKVMEIQRYFIAHLSDINACHIRQMIETVAKMVRCSDVQNATVVMSVVETIFAHCTADRTLNFIHPDKSNALRMIHEIMSDAHFLSPLISDSVSQELFQLHRSILTILDYAADSEEGKTLCARSCGEQILGVLTVARPYDVHRLAAAVLVNLVKGSERILHSWLPDEWMHACDQVLRTTSDGYLQMQLAEFWFRFIQLAKHLDQEYLACVTESISNATISGDGRRLLKILASLHPTEKLLHDISRVLESYNKELDVPLIISIPVKQIDFGELCIRGTTIYFGPVLMLLDWNAPELTVPYKYVRSIRIQQGATLLFKLHSLPTQLKKIYFQTTKLAPGECYELRMTFEKTQIELLKQSNVRRWIQTEQVQPKCGKEGIVSASPSIKVEEKLNTPKCGTKEIEPEVGDSTLEKQCGSFTPLSAKPRDPLALSESKGTHTSKEDESRCENEGSTTFDPTPSTLNAHTIDSENNDCSVGSLQSSGRHIQEGVCQKRKRVPSEADCIDKNVMACNDEIVPSLMEEEGRLRVKTARYTPQEFKIGAQVSEELEAMISQLRQGITQEDSTQEQREGLRKLKLIMEDIQAEIDNLKIKTNNERRLYLDEVKKSFESIHDMKQMIKERFSKTVQDLNAKMTNIVQQHQTQANYVIELEENFLRFADFNQTEEEQALLSLKKDVEKSMCEMEGCILNLTNHVQPLKYMLSRATRKTDEL